MDNNNCKTVSQYDMDITCRYISVSQYDMDYTCKLCSNKYVDIMIHPCGCRTHNICQKNNLTCNQCSKQISHIWNREDRIGRKWTLTPTFAK